MVTLAKMASLRMPTRRLWSRTPPRGRRTIPASPRCTRATTTRGCPASSGATRRARRSPSNARHPTRTRHESAQLLGPQRPRGSARRRPHVQDLLPVPQRDAPAPVAALDQALQKCGPYLVVEQGRQCCAQHRVPLEVPHGRARAAGRLPPSIKITGSEHPASCPTRIGPFSGSLTVTRYVLVYGDFVD